MPLRIADKDKQITRTYSLTQELPNVISSTWTTVTPTAKIDEISTYQYATTVRSGSFASHEESVYIDQTVSTDVFRAVTSIISSYESTKTITDVSYNTSDNAKFTSYNKTVTYTAFDREETRIEDTGDNYNDSVRGIASYNTESMSFGHTTFPAASASSKYSNGSTLLTISVTSDFNCVLMSKTNVQNQIIYFTNDSYTAAPIYTYASDFPYSNDNITIDKDGDYFYITRNAYDVAASIYSSLSFNPYGTHTSQTNFIGKITAGLTQTTAAALIAEPIPEMYRTSAAFFNLYNNAYPAFGIAYRQLCSSSMDANISSLVNDTYNAESTAFVSYAEQSVTGHASVQMTQVDHMYTNYIQGDRKSTWEDYLYRDSIMSNYSSALSNNQEYFYLHNTTSTDAGYKYDSVLRNAVPAEISIWTGASVTSTLTRVTGLSQSSSEDTTAYAGSSSFITTTATSASLSVSGTGVVKQDVRISYNDSRSSTYGTAGSSSSVSTSGYTGNTSISTKTSTAISESISASTSLERGIHASGSTKYDTTTSANATKVWSSSLVKTSISTSSYANNVTINFVSFTHFYNSFTDNTVGDNGATAASTTKKHSFYSTGASNATTYHTSALDTLFASTSYSSSNASFSSGDNFYVTIGTYNDGHPNFYLNFPGSFTYRNTITVMINTSTALLNPWYSTSASVGNAIAFYSNSTRICISCTNTNKPTYWGAIFGLGEKTFAYTATTTATSPYGSFTNTVKVYGNMPNYVVPDNGTGFANQGASRLYIVKPNYALTSFKFTTYQANWVSASSISSIFYSTLTSNGVPSSGTISTVITSIQTATTSTKTASTSTSLSSYTSASTTLSGTKTYSVTTSTYISTANLNLISSLQSLGMQALENASYTITSTYAQNTAPVGGYKYAYSAVYGTTSTSSTSQSSSTNTNGSCTIPNLSSTTALTRSDTFTTTTNGATDSAWTSTAYVTTSSVYSTSTQMITSSNFTGEGTYIMQSNFLTASYNTNMIYYPLSSSSSTIPFDEWYSTFSGSSSAVTYEQKCSTSGTAAVEGEYIYYTETYPEYTTSTATFDTVTKSLTSSKFDTFTVESSTTFPDVEYVTDQVSETHYYATTTNVGTTTSLTETYSFDYKPELSILDSVTISLTDVSTHNTLI